MPWRRKPRSAASRKRERLRYLRKHHPFPRFSFDAAWQTAVDTLTHPLWTFLGRGFAAADFEELLRSLGVHEVRTERWLTYYDLVWATRPMNGER